VLNDKTTVNDKLEGSGCGLFQESVPIFARIKMMKHPSCNTPCPQIFGKRDMKLKKSKHQILTQNIMIIFKCGTNYNSLQIPTTRVIYKNIKKKKLESKYVSKCPHIKLTFTPSAKAKNCQHVYYQCDIHTRAILPFMLLYKFYKI
jgi:hypothetical protein